MKQTPFDLLIGHTPTMIIEEKDITLPEVTRRKEWLERNRLRAQAALRNAQRLIVQRTNQKKGERHYKGFEQGDKVCVMTVRLGPLFFFPIFSLSPSTVLLRSSMPCGRCASYLFTRLTLVATVLLTHASAPADAPPLCIVHACISSPLPYVSLHLLCTPPDPLTCVVPCPLYAFS